MAEQICDSERSEEAAFSQNAKDGMLRPFGYVVAVAD